jgi:transposase
MSVTPLIPDDPTQYQRLLEDLLSRNEELRRQAQTAQQQTAIAQQHAQTAQQQAATAEQQFQASQQHVEDAVRRLGELERVLDQTAADYDRLKEKHAELAETLALFRRYVFGPRRERFIDDPGQGHLFDIPEIITEPESASPTSPDASATQRSTAARSPRRTRLDHLPHIRIPHDVPEEEKTCSCCGGPKTCIGEDESRELDFIPAKLEVKVHVLPKYACPKCRDGVTSPPVPPKPIAGGIAGAGLVSFVITSKFADHLPLYRLEDILTRHGVFLSRSTLCDWVRNAALLLTPLAELQKTLILQSPIIWTDDTSVTVLGVPDTQTPSDWRRGSRHPNSE